MSQDRTIRRHRLNVRALIALVIVLALGIPGVLLLRSLQNERSKAAFLSEARTRIEKGELGLALSYLNRYLRLDPTHPEALDLKSRVLCETAVSPDQVSEAAQLHVRVLGLPGDPTSAERLATRRRLIELSLRQPDRGQVAEAQARELVALIRQKGGPDAVDAPTRRLFASALEHAAEIASDDSKRTALIEEARAEYEAAEALDPGDVDGAIRLAALYQARLNDREKAAQVLDRAVAATAARPESHAEALLARAQFAIEFGGPAGTPRAEVERAIQDDIDRAIAEAPANPKGRLTAARAALRRRDTVAARKHLEAIPDDRKPGSAARLVEGQIELSERRLDAAIAAWRAGLVESGGSDAELAWRLAQVLLEVGRPDEAQVLIDQFRRLAGDTDGARYHYLLGLRQLRSNRPADAISEFESVRYKIDPTLETQLQFALGQAYEATRDVPRAIEAYRRAAEVSQDWSGPWLALAGLEVATDPDAAKNTLRRGLALMPRDARLLGSLARLLWSEQLKKPQADRRWGEVEQLLAEADRAAPGEPDVALIRAEYLAAVGRPEEAFALLEAAARLRPDAAELWLALAAGAVRRGELGEATKWIDRGLDAAGPQAGFFITRASILVIKGDVTKARDALVEGIARVPLAQRPLLWKTLGELYQARRDNVSARSAFEAWAKLQPDNPDPRIALVLLAIDDHDEAAIAAAIESVRNVTGARGYYWRYARVEDLLRSRPTEPPDPERDSRRREEARKLIAEIQGSDPRLPLGNVLQGRLYEAEGKVDEAIAAYREGVAQNGGAAALNPLLALLVREKRDAEIDELRRTYPGGALEFDRLAAVQALRAGNKDRAEQLAALAVQGDPQGVDVRTWQAEVLQALGKPDEAERSLTELVGRRPSEPAPWLQLLMLQVSRGRTAEALATIEQMKGKVKSDYPELLWAQCYRAAGDLRRAAESYEAALRRWPNDLGVLLSSVGFFQQSGQRDRAEALLRSVLKRDPSNAAAKRRLAESLASHASEGNAWAEAVETIGAEPRLDDVPDDLITRARVFGQGPTPADRQKAIAILEGLVAELPGLDVARDLLARLLYAQGKRREASEQIALVAKGARPTPDAVLFYASLLLDQGELDEAEAQIDRLARVAPDGLPVAELRSRLLTARGRRAEAGRPLEAAFEAIPAGPGALEPGTKILRALLGIGQHEAAERVARKLAEISTRGGCLLAELLATLGRGDEAAAELENAAKAGDDEGAGATALTLAVTRPNEPRWGELADRYLGRADVTGPGASDVLERLALLRHVQGRFDDEIAIYKKMLAANPSSFLFLNNMAWTLAVDLGRPQEAIDWADRAIEKVGPRPEILDTRGVILTRLGRLDDAIRDLQAAVSASPSSPSFLFHLALAYQKKGDLGQARAHRDRARVAGFDPTALREPERADWDLVKDL